MPLSLPLVNRKTLVIGLILFIGFWLTTFSFTLWQLHREARNNAISEAKTYARNFSEYLTQNLQVVSLIADNIDLKTDRPESLAEIDAYLRKAVRPAPYLRSLSLLDAEGKVVASSQTENIGLQMPLDNFYPELAPGSLQIRIAAPWRGRDLKNSQAIDQAKILPPETSDFIPVLRRVGSKKGSFWLLAALNPDYFIDRFGELLPPAVGHAQVLRYDGILLLSSWPEDTLGASGGAGQVEQELQKNESGELLQTLPNGFQAITAYRASSRFPLVVAVHMDRQHIHERWLADTGRLSLIVLPILLALSLAAFLIWRHEQRIKMHQAELAEQRQLAASVFDASGDAIMLTNPTGELLSTNPAFEHMNGYSSGEVLGKNPRLLASGRHDRNFFAKLWQQLLAEGHWQGEIINRHKNGSLYTGLLTINAVKDNQGRLTHYVGVTVDITERKRHESELLAAKELAEAASRAKTTFLASMSHELRTPISGVIGMTELLLRSELNEKQRRQSGLIRDSADKLLKIIDEILEYAKIDARDLRLKQAPFAPEHLLCELLPHFVPPAAAKGLQLRHLTSPDLPKTVVGAVEPIRGILGRLLDNAIKFSSNGEIILAAQTETGSPPGFARLSFSVTDNGIGIAPDKQEMIFAAFSQADGSSSRAFGGSGLGLAICQGLANAIGGTLKVESEYGSGSCFTLCVDLPLPVDESAPENQAPVHDFPKIMKPGCGFI